MSFLPTIQPKALTKIGDRTFVWGSKTFVMGIVNATPDSFSGDGVGTDVDRAVQMAREFVAYGCDIIDIGGESTRPPLTYTGNEPTSETDELARILPVVDAISQVVDVPISIDTYKASVAESALNAGASLVNDVYALQKDPNMLSLVARLGVPVVLMHNQEHTRYKDVVTDVIRSLSRLSDRAVNAGVSPENIVVDPGMGFGKTAQQNLEILRRLDEFQVLDSPILVGISRKSTIGRVLGLPPDRRLEGTAATVALSVAGGADIVRVHDVKEIARVALMSDAVVRGWEPPE